MNTKLPIIEQLHNAGHGAGSERERARILLACPDAMLMKYVAAFRSACDGWREGDDYVALRVGSLLATRDPAGLLRAEDAEALDDARVALWRVSIAPPPSIDP